jgi:hypothetical protein
LVYIALVMAVLALAVALSTAHIVSSHNRSLVAALAKALSNTPDTLPAPISGESDDRPLIVQLAEMPRDEDVDPPQDLKPYLLSDEYEAEMEAREISEGRAVEYS